MPSSATLLASYLSGVFIITLSIAAICAIAVGLVANILGAGEVILHTSGWFAPENISVHILSYFIGLPLALAASWFLLLRPGMPFSLLLKPLAIGDKDFPVLETDKQMHNA